MNLRPRCETFLPLATQQMRLRNLTKIEGMNIVCMEQQESLIYYTLHHRNDSESFYKSEALPQRNQLNWSEIVNIEMAKSNANCVCVKVWVQFENFLPNDEKSELRNEVEYDTKKDYGANYNREPCDKLLFSWGVYFSGLISLNRKLEMNYSSNTLIFEINGNLFGSSANFTAFNLEKYFTRNSEVYKEGSLFTHDGVVNSSLSNLSNKEDQSVFTFRSRYSHLYFPRKAVRQGYNLEKILRIQQLQRICAQKKRESSDMKSQIKQKCVRCITSDDIAQHPKWFPKNQVTHTSRGRTLSILLAEEQYIDPKHILLTQEIEKQIETMRSKRKLLQSEHVTFVDRISQKKMNHKISVNQRLYMQSWLSQHMKQVETEREELTEIYQINLNLLITKRNIMQNVEKRMSGLCLELREIYPIEQKHMDFYTICNIPILNMYSYVNELKYGNSAVTDNISPLALSTSLGYIAHLVHMVSIILDQPLRNRIICEGSRSRITDKGKSEYPFTREFPLYSRSAILSKHVQYAIHLLNQNIAQLCYDITGIRCDLKATVENILIIFSTLAKVEQNQLDLIARCSTHPNNRIRLQSDLKSSQINNNHNISTPVTSKSLGFVGLHQIDGVQNRTSMIHFLSSAHMAINSKNPNRQRISRSVGSYSDCEDEKENRKVSTEQILSNSDSNIPKFQSEIHQ